MRRGVTLLELLLALALVVALGAIALPAMLETSEHEVLNETAEAIEGRLLLARAHAMVTGTSVDVRFETATSRLIVCDLATTTDEASRADAKLDDEPVLVKRSWAQLDVRPVITLSTEPPESAMHDDDAAPMNPFAITSFSAPAIEEPAENEERGWITIAVYLPDGSAPVAEPVWLWTAEGRVIRIDIGPWTGIPHIDREPLADDEPLAEEPEPEEESEEEELESRSDAPEPDNEAADDGPREGAPVESAPDEAEDEAEAEDEDEDEP